MGLTAEAPWSFARSCAAARFSCSSQPSRRARWPWKRVVASVLHQGRPKGQAVQVAPDIFAPGIFVSGAKMSSSRAGRLFRPGVSSEWVAGRRVPCVSPRPAAGDEPPWLRAVPLPARLASPRPRSSVIRAFRPGCEPASRGSRVIGCAATAGRIRVIETARAAVARTRPPRTRGREWMPAQKARSRAACGAP
jgi:hypothetical protein